MQLSLLKLGIHHQALLLDLGLLLIGLGLHCKALLIKLSTLLIGLGALLDSHLLHLGTKLGDLHAVVRRHLRVRCELLCRLINCGQFLGHPTQLLLDVLLHLHDHLDLIGGFFGDQVLFLGDRDAPVRLNQIIIQQVIAQVHGHRI